MAFGETMKQADQYAERALEIMREKDIPPAPLNYSVWYHYVSDSDPKLKSAVNALMESDNDVGVDATAELYERFIENGDQEELFLDTAEKMKSELCDVTEVIGDARDDFSDFHDAVKTGLRNFTAAKDMHGIQNVIQKLVIDARNVQSVNQDLQDRLIKSSAEIEKLQNNLLSAQKESLTDCLTSIANRKMFDEVLAKTIGIAKETSGHFCLVMCDIDFFKKFNDTFGHQVGDHVLKLVASVLHENVKGSDLAARYGGEEFALILPETSLSSAFSLVEKIRNSIANRAIKSRKKQQNYGRVTLSLGIAEYRGDDSAATLIDRADTALYHAKETGRNKTVLESELG